MRKSIADTHTNNLGALWSIPKSCCKHYFQGACSPPKCILGEAHETNVVRQRFEYACAVHTREFQTALHELGDENHWNGTRCEGAQGGAQNASPRVVHLASL